MRVGGLLCICGVNNKRNNMIKIYGTKKNEQELLPVLAEFRIRAFTSYPVKGMTKKVRGKNTYRVVDFPA